MKKTKTIFNIIITTLSTLAIILNSYIVYKKIIQKDEIVNIFNYSFLVVISGSMEPNISVDDLIIIKKEEKYSIDDVVTYKDKYAFITHRIVRIENENYWTKGDNNNTEDSAPVKQEQILGKVKYKLKGFGKIINVISFPPFIALFIVLAFWLLVKK